MWTLQNMVLGRWWCMPNPTVPNASVKSNQLDLASSYLESYDVVTGYNPTT